jgi:CubicO group peptidase (beta-lactamase class C family)
MEKIFEQIAAKARETDFSGVVSIFRGDTAVFHHAYGRRNYPDDLPNTPDTRFGIASGTKLFTALAIGLLIDQGMLALHTPVAEIDPAYTGFIDPRATIRHLLTHTSGVYDYYDEELIEDFDNFFIDIPWYQLETSTDYLPLFLGQTMKFAPGARFSYSNGGFVLLGMIIEKLTRMRYWEFMTAELLRPSHMPRSGFFPLNALPPNTAHGYLTDRTTTNIYNLPIRGGGDGGMFTTSAELCAFWDNFLAHKILSPALTAAFLATQFAFNNTHGYGCGLYKKLDDSLFYIVGGDAGVGFDSRHLPVQNMTINIFSNVTNGEEEMREVLRPFF